MAIRNANLGGTDWGAETLTYPDLNDTFDATYDTFNPSISPVGSVTAWLKSLTNTPALPANWVECNGQTISDADSPYNGVTIPNLNGPVDTGLKGYFLRGHSSSGVTETSQNLAHTHSVGLGISDVNNPNNACNGDNSTYANLGTSSSGGTEARPHNYSVVWIMRIK